MYSIIGTRRERETEDHLPSDPHEVKRERHFYWLPDEIMVHIFQYAASPRSALVCKRWRRIEASDQVWKPRAVALGLERPSGASSSLKELVIQETTWPRQNVCKPRYGWSLLRKASEVVVTVGATFANHNGDVWRYEHGTGVLNYQGGLPHPINCNLIRPNEYWENVVGELCFRQLSNRQLIRSIELPGGWEPCVEPDFAWYARGREVGVWDYSDRGWVVYEVPEGREVYQCLYKSGQVLLVYDDGSAHVFGNNQAPKEFRWEGETRPEYSFVGGAPRQFDEKFVVPINGMEGVICQGHDGSLRVIAADGHERKLEKPEGEFQLWCAARPRPGILLLGGRDLLVYRWDTGELLEVYDHGWGMATQLYLAEEYRVIVHGSEGGGCFRFVPDSEMNLFNEYDLSASTTDSDLSRRV